MFENITLHDAQVMAILITSMCSGIVAIITALKIKQVHTLVNSAMAQEKAENTLLRSILTAKQLEIDNAEKTRVTLSEALAQNRINNPSQTS